MICYRRRFSQQTIGISGFGVWLADATRKTADGIVKIDFALRKTTDTPDGPAKGEGSPTVSPERPDDQQRETPARVVEVAAEPEPAPGPLDATFTPTSHDLAGAHVIEFSQKSRGRSSAA